MSWAEERFEVSRLTEPSYDVGDVARSPMMGPERDWHTIPCTCAEVHCGGRCMGWVL
jgi:hypothetical protein